MKLVHLKLHGRKLVLDVDKVEMDLLEYLKDFWTKEKE